MPIFNPKLFDKKKRETKTISNKFTYKILKKTVIGVCCITNTGEYFVVTEDKSYKFSDDSYIIKKDKPFYAQQIINGKRVQIISNRYENYSNKLTYLPFAPGVCCIGDIVYNEITKLTVFKLKDTFIDKTSQIALNAWNFFVKNYDEIRHNINGNK